MSAPRVGVVGHVEWLDFAVVEHLPAPGEIVTSTSHFEAAAGGGAVAAVQLRKLAGAATFLTALGDDERAARAAAELREQHGLTLHAATRARPQRRAFTHLDGHAERTITVLGERLVPHGADPLPWDELAALDGIYFTGGDTAAAHAARRARVLVATTRAQDALRASGVVPDVLIASASDAKERAGAAALALPRWLVLTDGARGGHWESSDGTAGIKPNRRRPVRRIEGEAQPLDGGGEIARQRLGIGLCPSPQHIGHSAEIGADALDHGAHVLQPGAASMDRERRIEDRRRDGLSSRMAAKRRNGAPASWMVSRCAKGRDASGCRRARTTSRCRRRRRPASGRAGRRCARCPAGRTDG